MFWSCAVWVVASAGGWPWVMPDTPCGAKVFVLPTTRSRIGALDNKVVCERDRITQQLSQCTKSSVKLSGAWHVYC